MFNLENYMNIFVIKKFNELRSPLEIMFKFLQKILL